MNDKQLSPHAACAAHIRKALATAYPETVFKVRSQSFSGGNSVHIGWTDGPKSKDVEAITNQYQYGSFDGMQDLYSADNNRDDIPQVKYVSASRSLSDAVVARIKASIELQFNLGKDRDGNDITELDLGQYNSYWSRHGYGMVSAVESGDLDCKILSDEEIDELRAARALKATVALAEAVVEQVAAAQTDAMSQALAELADVIEKRPYMQEAPDPKFKVNDRIGFLIQNGMKGMGTVIGVISRDEWCYALKDIRVQGSGLNVDAQFPEVPESCIFGRIAESEADRSRVSSYEYQIPPSQSADKGANYDRFLQVSRELDRHFQADPEQAEVFAEFASKALTTALAPALKGISDALDALAQAVTGIVKTPEFQAALAEAVKASKEDRHD